MNIVLIVLAVALIAGLIYLFTLPNGYSVERQITINKPITQVYDYVKNLENWVHWSPWNIHDPNTVMTYDRPNEVGGSYAWDSKHIGIGSMTTLTAVPYVKMTMDLRFIKPFKSQADVQFLFDSNKTAGDANSTTVTWRMQCKMPLPMRPMVGMISRMIGNDFALGLGLLRGCLDPAAEYPALGFDGVMHLSAQTCIGEAYEGSIDGLKDAFARIYPALYSEIEPNNIAGAGVAAYHRINVGKTASKMSTVCDITVPVKQAPAALSNTKTVQLPGGKYFQTTLRGSYEFIGPAWNASWGHLRMVKLKHDKSRPMLETYHQSRNDTPNSNEWVTYLAIPVK